jgi:hypothetical protein
MAGPNAAENARLAEVLKEHPLSDGVTFMPKTEVDLDAVKWYLSFMPKKVRDAILPKLNSQKRG